MNFDQLRSVQLDANTFPNDLGGIHEIFQYRVIHSRQRTRTRTLLLVFRARLTRRLRKDLALAYEYYVLTGELLLQLAHQTRLNFLERFQFRHRNVDDNRLQQKFVFDDIKTVLHVENSKDASKTYI